MLLAVEKTDDDLLTIMKDDLKEKTEIDKSFPISGESFKRPASGTQ